MSMLVPNAQLSITYTTATIELSTLAQEQEMLNLSKLNKYFGYNHRNNFELYTIVIAIYPGSFDPITLGHLDIIQRGCRLFDFVIVAVLRNPNKMPLFTVQQRLEQIRLTTKHLPNVEVDSFDGLTVNYAQMREAQVLIRGLRAVSDFEIELQMAHTNKTLSTQIETVFLATSNEYSFLSSSVVREIARFGGSVDHLVPPHIALEIYQCYDHNSPKSNQIITETISPLKTMPMETPPEKLCEREA